MISYLEGEILLKRDKFIVVKTGGVGYQVFLSQKTLMSLPNPSSPINPVRNSLPSAGGVSNGVKLHIFHNIGEKVSDLYGFTTLADLEFFELLLDIHGVGPKAALEISAVGPLEKIKEKILAQDENVFAGIPGIGQKKAMSIMLELTGKIKLPGNKKASGDPAEDALVQLGFSKQQAREALEGVPSDLDEQERIKLALKGLGK